GDYGFAVSLIHGDRTQGQRNQAIQNFRLGRYRIHCATEVAARGVDIPAIEHVINYHLPMMTEDHVHRSGRTGRNGAPGEAVSFVGTQDHRTWLTIARKYKITGVELRSVRREDGGPRNEGGGKFRSGGFRKKSKPSFGKRYGSGGGGGGSSA